MTRAPQVHILRLVGPDGDRFEPIAEDAWLAALAATDGVRPSPTGLAVPNPITGRPEPLWQARHRDGDVDMGPEGGWTPVLAWKPSGSISMTLDFDLTDASDPRTWALFELAARLGAAVVGDAGEPLQPPSPGN